MRMPFAFTRGERTYDTTTKLAPLPKSWRVIPLPPELILYSKPEELLYDEVNHRLQQPKQDTLYFCVGKREFETTITPIALTGDGQENLTQVAFIAYSPKSTKPATTFALTFNLVPEEAETAPKSPPAVSLINKDKVPKEYIQLATHILRESRPISEIATLAFSEEEAAVVENLNYIKNLPVLRDRLMEHVVEELKEQRIQGDGLLQDPRFQTLTQILKPQELIKYFGLASLPFKYKTAELIAAVERKQWLNDTYNVELGIVLFAIFALGVESFNFYQHFWPILRATNANFIEIIKNSPELKWFVGTLVFGFLNAQGLVSLATRLERAKERVNKARDVITSRALFRSTS